MADDLAMPLINIEMLGSGGAQATTQSPKIVISDSQLKQLKLKMLALKNKRRLEPLALPSAHLKETIDLTTALEGPIGAQLDRATLQVPVSDCPGTHGLSVFQTPGPGWWCSVCEREHQKGTTFYGCRDCNHDECPIRRRVHVGRDSKGVVQQVIRQPTWLNYDGVCLHRHQEFDRIDRSGSGYTSGR